MSVELVVQEGLPHDWDAITRHAPVPARRWWIELGRSRLGAGYQSFTLRENGMALVSMIGAILTEPPTRARLDPFAILAGHTVSQGLAAAAPPPWSSEQSENVFPCLLLMYPDYASFPVGTKASAPAILGDFLAALTDWADGTGIAATALLYLTPTADPLMEALPATGFQLVPLTGQCDLDVTWGDFNGYLATLPNKRSAQMVRRELRRIDEQGLILTSRPLSAQEPELIRLRCMQVAKYGATPNVEVEQRYMAQLFARPEGDVTVFTMQRTEQVLGFAVFVQDDDIWTVALAGTDYAAAGSRFAYFSNLFYQPAREAPIKNVRTIAYGPGSLDAKRRRGCRITQLMAAGRLRG